MVNRSKKPDVLTELLSVASREVLTKLILSLAFQSPENRRECFDYLKENVTVSKALVKRSEGEVVLALWSELEPDLEDLDTYGGGDYAIEDHVVELLQQIEEKSGPISTTIR